MSNTDVTRQLILIGYMAMLGAGTMLLFQFAGELLRQTNRSKRKQLCIDFTLCIICGTAVCIVLITQNDGTVRSYIVLGMLLGMSVYHYLLRRYCNGFCKVAAKGTIFIVKMCCRVLYAPWRLCNHCVIQPIQKRIKQRKIAATQDDEVLEEII